MPYIREELKQDPEFRNELFWRDPGTLTYDIQVLLQSYLLRLLDEEGRYGYADLAVMLGAIEGAKADFIRRVVTPYEEDKQEQNGDVWRV